MHLSKTVLPALQSLLAEFAGASSEEVVRGLISLAPTRHTVELASGTRIFTFCTLDTLLIPRLLGEDARLSSAPPGEAVQAAPLSYAVAGGKLRAGADWVVAFPRIQPGAAGEFRGSFCPYANAFPSSAAYTAWAARQRVDTAPLTFAQADALAREYAAAVHEAAPQVCGCGCGI